jgi:hypothetical protein
VRETDNRQQQSCQLCLCCTLAFRACSQGSSRLNLSVLNVNGAAYLSDILQRRHTEGRDFIYLFIYGLLSVARTI